MSGADEQDENTETHERRGVDGDRLFAIRSGRGRWARATIAACLTYPADYRETVAEWSALMDYLEEGITRAEMNDSVELAATNPVPAWVRARRRAERRGEP